MAVMPLYSTHADKQQAGNILDRIALGIVGIGHTRWATHGKATDLNAHPFLSADGMFAVAHNGIIENYTGLKAFLSEKGFSFVSDTDSEVVPMLLEYFYDGDVLKAIRRAVSELEGAFSLAIITSHAPDCVFAARKDSSLAIGFGKGCSFVSSDIPAISGFAEQCCIPDENSVAVLRKGEIKLFDRQGNRTAPSFKPTGECGGDAEKGDFPFFMLKEIFSQPRCLTDAAAQFTDGKRLKKILFSDEEANAFNRVKLIGCGSAYHAGVAGKNFIERLAGIPAEAELAGEFRYRDVLCDESRIRGKRASFPHAPRERHKSLRRFCAVQVGICRCGRHKSVLYSVKPRVDQERERKIRIGKRIGRTKLDMLSGALCRRDPHKL